MGHKKTQTALAKSNAAANIGGIERRIERDKQSRGLQRNQVTSVFKSTTRDLHQALADLQRNSASTLRGLETERADVIAGRTSLLRELGQRKEKAGADLESGTRDIEKFRVRGVARERNEAADRGIFRSGIRQANVQEVRADAADAEVDLNTTIETELEDIKADRDELQANVDRILTEIDAKKKDLETATGVARRNILEDITDLEGQRDRDLEAIKQSDLTLEFKTQIRDIQKRLSLTLASINASGHGGGGGNTVADITQALIEAGILEGEGEIPEEPAEPVPHTDAPQGRGGLQPV